MTAQEAFERAFWEGRASDLVEEVVNWSWLEERYNRALIDGDPVAAGYCAGRLSRRGEFLFDEQGMAYTYELER